MDGHAYSGRFYAFLNSKSVPFKLTFFREWHENRILLEEAHNLSNFVAVLVEWHVVDPGEENVLVPWKYRYLLDMDGHAYSGRFYAFLNSKSVPFKLTFFNLSNFVAVLVEWHVVDPGEENVLVPFSEKGQLEPCWQGDCSDYW
jgi:hypothetical protein